MGEPFRTASPPSTENAVRSIRVASTLIDRFQAILKTSAGFAGMNVDQLELLIGESQQLYPEIWRHLDEAYKELGKLGRNVSQFEHLRREELGHLGVTDVDVSTAIDPFSLMLGRYRQVTIKSASFNAEGCRRAAYAAGTLMNAMPEVDWQALAQAEAREIAAAGSLQSKKYLTVLKVVIGVVVLAVIAIAIRACAMTAAESTYDRRTRLTGEDRVEDPGVLAYRAAMARRMARIDELWEQFAKTCEAPTRLALVELLREDNRVKDADIVAHKTCVPARPDCPSSLDNIAKRILDRVPRDHDVVPHCDGILKSAGGSQPGLAMPALLITIPGKPLLRGVISPDGKVEVVPLGEGPGATVVGVGDLDDDNTDELVTVDSDKLVVSRIAGTRFVDILGPTLPAGCNGDVTVERDFRRDPKGEHKRIKIFVDKLQRRDGCLSEGRHYFRLVADKIVED